MAPNQTTTGTHRRWRRPAAWAAGVAMVAGALALAPGAEAVAPSSTPSWGRQFGTGLSDTAVDVAVSPTGVVYTYGYTAGNLGGTNAGNSDIWLARHNASGTRRWTRQFGTSSIEYPTALAVSPGGDVYVVGGSEGSLVGTNVDTTTMDGFIAKYDQYGRRRWIRQIATTTAGDDEVRAIAISPSGEIFVAGTTAGDLAGPGVHTGALDLWVARYDRNGNRAWIQQYGTAADDYPNAIAVNAAGQVIVAGETDGSLPETDPNAGNRDFFMVAYDRTGARQGNLQWGTSEDDSVQGVAFGAAGEVYVAGFTNGTLPGQSSSGGRDAVLTRIDFAPGPGFTWTRQSGSDSNDEWADVAVRGNDVFVGGHSLASLAQPTAGSYDFVAARFGANGQQKWIDQFGSSGLDLTSSVALSRSGDLYLAGSTSGELVSPNLGAEDAALVKYGALRNNSWVSQIGNSGNDYYTGVTLSSDGYVWSVGYTGGPGWFGTDGNVDILVTKHDANGNVQSTTRFGTDETDYAMAAARGPAGSIVVVGVTQGDLSGTNGGSSIGDNDGFVALIDADGEVQWKRQIGSLYFDALNAVAVTASGGIYVAGSAGGAVEDESHAGDSDFMIAKYDSNGSRQWLRLSGTVGEEIATGITITRGSLFVVGRGDHTFTTPATPTGQRPVMMRFTTNGTRRWARQYTVADGTGEFSAVASTPTGEIFATGSTTGSMQTGVANAGDRDMVVVRLDTNGNRRWTRQYGVAGNDRPYGIATTALGTVTMVGTTRGEIGGSGGVLGATPQAGNDDIVMMRFDRNGRRTLYRQWGTAAFDEATAVTVSPRGTVFIVGSTEGSLGAANAGDTDAVTIRFNA